MKTIFPLISLLFLLYIGHATEAPSLNNSDFVIVANNYIYGNVYEDANFDCNPQFEEHKHINWIVKLHGLHTLYTTTDFFGNYAFTVDTGSYELELIFPNGYWEESCISAAPIEFYTNFDTIQKNIATLAIIDCPYLKVDISSSSQTLKRCASNTFDVYYCNSGTTDSYETFIDVTLDNFLTVDSVSNNVAYAPGPAGGNIYTFTVDTLRLGECGSFKIYTTLDCSAAIGHAHCVEAHIFPDLICLSPSNWSGASIKVEGYCDQDSVRFTIRNTSFIGMETQLQYIVIEDEVILRSEPYLLNGNDTHDINIKSNGRTLRLECEQEANHPGISQPSIVISGCGGPPTSGFVNQHPMDDGNDFIDIDCRENTESSNFSMKQGFPNGYGTAHYIKAEQDIEYFVRFQNTDTDTVYQVIITDTLPAELNVATIRPGAASHPYNYWLSGEGVAHFVFQNLALPDSAINEPASHGFVKFRISQETDLAMGTTIENKADICYNLNPPIVSNQTWHTIGQNFIDFDTGIHSPNQLSPIKVYPNPFAETATIELEKTAANRWFELYDSNGRLLQRQSFSEQQYQLQANNFPAGLYLFKIIENHVLVNSGKLVLK